MTLHDAAQVQANWLLGEGIYGTQKFSPEFMKEAMASCQCGYEFEFYLNDQAVQFITQLKGGSRNFLGNMEADYWEWLTHGLSIYIRKNYPKGSKWEIVGDGTLKDEIPLKLDKWVAVRMHAKEPVMVENGLEVVTPVFTAENSLIVLHKFLAWMQQYAVTTNRCGLHVNISTLQDWDKFNPAKATYLSGEKYFGNKFGRYDTPGESSYRPWLSDKNKSDSWKLNNDLLKQTLDYERGDSAKKPWKFSYGKSSVPSGETGWYKGRLRSINYGNPERAEFRIPGGQDYQFRAKEIEEAVRHFCAATWAGTQQAAYRKDYLHRLGSTAVQRGV